MKGKWIEIDRDRLNQASNNGNGLRKAKKVSRFLEGMRMLAGLGRGGAGDPLASLRPEWSQVVPGEWLRQTLGAMRDPSVIEEFDPERDLHAN